VKEPSGWAYLAVFFATALLTLVLTPLALRIAVRRDIVDRPGPIKAQPSPVPYLGGTAILVAFTVAVLAAAVLRKPTSGLDELAIILGLALLLGVVGLVDDLRGLSAWFRLLLEVAAGIVVWATPAGAQLFTADVPNLLVTVLWIVGITNAFNLLDNMDGLSAGVAGVAAAFLFVMAAENGQFLVGTLAIALAGCAAGFLRSNFHPARIYMGDSGSLFLGFLLAVLALKLDFVAAPRIVALGVPVILLGVPVCDTVLVILTRLRHGTSPFLGGRDHISHRLVHVGIPVPVAVFLIYIAAASLGTLAFVLSRIDRGTAFVLLAWLGTVGSMTCALLAAVPVYETSSRRRIMLREVQDHEIDPPADHGVA
jgi:UDP-GlcNAc:undecaprenyl-phosphate GlcNAc-1-phosphate transferase